MGNKLGIYFCNCGTAVADKIDSAKIEEGLKSSGEVVHFRCHELLCSEEGKQFLEEDLRANGVERAVICACSPATMSRPSCAVSAGPGAIHTSCRW